MNSRIVFTNSERSKYMTFNFGRHTIKFGDGINETTAKIYQWMKDYPCLLSVINEVKNGTDWEGLIRREYIMLISHGNLIAKFQFNRPVKCDKDFNVTKERYNKFCLVAVELNIGNLIYSTNMLYKITDDTLIKWVISYGKTKINNYKELADALGSIKCGGYKVVNSKTLIENIQRCNIPGFYNRNVNFEGTQRVRNVLTCNDDMLKEDMCSYKLCIEMLNPILTTTDYTQERAFIGNLKVELRNIVHYKHKMLITLH